MADVKNFALGFLFVVMILSAAAVMYSWAVVQGGWSGQYPRSFQSAQSYLNTTKNITDTLQQQASNVANTPASTDPTLTYGTILAVGLQVLTIPIQFINLAVSMLSDIAATPALGGFLPGWFIVSAIIFIVLIIIFGILAAVVKWLL